MFENIIGQGRTVALLGDAVKRNTLAPAALFTGPAYSGKLSVALELARILSCKASGDRSCDCPACLAQRRLLHPYTLLLGNRYFSREIAACARALSAGDNRATRHLFIRSARKLLRRFDPALWDDDDVRLKKARPLLTPLMENLEELDPDRDITEKRLIKLISQATEQSAALASVLAGYTVNIGQVRALVKWTAVTPQETRVVIIERADRMQESARNALLKTLEEPPRGLYFILIAGSANNIMPTILSRARHYPFLERSSSEVKEVVERIFKTPYQNESLAEFFLGGDQEKLRIRARNFLNGKDVDERFSQAYVKEIDQDFSEFLGALADLVMADLHAGIRSAGDAAKLITGINAMKREYETYNRNPQSLCEGFYFT